MAKINFNNYADKEELKRYIYLILTPHAKYIKEDNWRGLPELMNKNNSFCSGSCATQAWSFATIIEALYELDRI
jgi:glycogen debranching enzyme